MKKITAIEPQKKRKHRFNLYLDNEFSMGIHEDVVLNCSLKVGKEIEESYIEKIVKTEEFAKAYDSALTLLSFRARSEKELSDRLKQKGFESDAISYSIEKLKEYHYIDDYRFGQDYIHDKQQFKKAGKGLLKSELLQKGLNKELVDMLLDESVDDDSEYQRAFELANKKYQSLLNIDYTVQYRRISGLLIRKGFSYDLVSKILSQIIKRDNNE